MLNGKRIREARLKAGIAQTTVDHAIGAPVGTCFRLEAEKGTIDPEQLTILCDILKSNRTWLLCSNDSDVPKSAKERVAEYMKKELKLWKMTAEMLKLKRQLGEDCYSEYEQLVNDLLEVIECD